MRLTFSRARVVQAAWAILLLWSTPVSALPGDNPPPGARPPPRDNPPPGEAPAFTNDDTGPGDARVNPDAVDATAADDPPRTNDATSDGDAAVAVAKTRARPDREVPFGFYRDPQGRVMQVSFDLQQRIWLGVAYAPRRRSNGQLEIAPAAFEFGLAYEETTPDGMTRQRFRVMDGEARLHPFGLDVTAFRYDLSRRYENPILRITTFLGEPQRHDLNLNVGFYTEALRLEVAPRGVEGEYALTLATLQGTLDLWQSRDLRSFVRLRVGPAIEARLGSWGQDARFVGFLPQSILEGNAILGKRALQLLTFRLRGELLRSLTVQPRALPWDWLVAAEGAWEVIFMAINDQPISLRLAAQAGLREDTGTTALPGSTIAGSTPAWEWKGTAALRVSFFSPPVLPTARR